MFDIIFWVKDLVGDPVFYSAVGVLVGWTGLQQPKWVRKTYDWVAAKF